MNREINNYLDKNPLMKEHYELGKFNNAAKVKDLQIRFCFDISHFCGLTKYFCKEIYSYADDNHIYTALKKICPKVIRKF